MAAGLAPIVSPALGPIRGRSCPCCCLCGASGALLYAAMPDRTFGVVAGEWSVRQCPDSDCGLLWLDPMPIGEDVLKMYETYYTHDVPERASRRPGVLRSMVDFVKSAYCGERFGRTDLEQSYRSGPRPGLLRKVASLPAYLHPFFRARLEFPIRALTRRKKGRLLDVGCGSGPLLRLAGRLGWEATGVDFDPIALANAARGGAKVLLGGVEEQHFASGAFDLVVMSHVIEHLVDPVAVLRECRRVLTAEGAAIVVTPNAGSWGHSIFGANWTGLDVPRHLHVFTKASLRKAAMEAGFGGVSVSSTAPQTQLVFETGARLESDVRFRPARAQHRFVKRLPWRVAFLVESALLKWRDDAGEELIMEATGDSEPSRR